MRHLRKQFINEEIDYVQLKSALSNYAHPRAKIRTLLKQGTIIRVKKGLYVFGKEEAIKPYSLETLANIIYGPSAISLEYALSFYGMIPERVDTVTSITTKRNKIFKTPLGLFTYHHLHPRKYPIGIEQYKIDSTHWILIANREKSLVDTITKTSPHFENWQELLEHLLENLRIDPPSLKKLSYTKLDELDTAYQHKNIKLLKQALRHYR